MTNNNIFPLLKKPPSHLSPEDFLSVINVVFRDSQAADYNDMHTNMSGSLQELVNLLLDDFLKNFKLVSQRACRLFGDQESELPETYQSKEQESIAGNKRNDRNVS